ncbi:MAG: guanylate kinase [Lachnospiraceae bacterium]|nr:guanylate kinase [Lachnospiraceae bacterium]
MQGLLIVISGFSGVGKGTIVKELLKRYPENFALSISATTRKPREGEVDGREYFFLTKKAFQGLIREDALIEHAVYNGNYYGTPRQYVQDMLDQGKNVILEIEMQGGLQIKAKYPETLLLYVVPPNAGELYRRLTKRGTETKEEILKRLRRGVDETAYITMYDALTVNDDLDACVEEVRELIEKQQKTVTERREFAKVLHDELLKLTEEVE